MSRFNFLPFVLLTGCQTWVMVYSPYDGATLEEGSTVVIAGVASPQCSTPQAWLDESEHVLTLVDAEAFTSEPFEPAIGDHVLRVSVECAHGGSDAVTTSFTVGAAPVGDSGAETL